MMNRAGTRGVGEIGDPVGDIDIVVLQTLTMLGVKLKNS